MHYWMREIGAETAGLFKLYLNRTMAEIMPYYNQLYKSAQLDFDPLNAYNYVETTMELENVESDGTRTDTADGKSLYSDTPQGLLDNGAIADEKYLTSATLMIRRLLQLQTIYRSVTEILRRKYAGICIII